MKLHALGPPEIVHIARLEKTGYEDVLTKLLDAGLDSLPGAGAEYKFNAEEIQKAILEAGFIPRLRNQKYEYLEMPSQVKKVN